MPNRQQAADRDRGRRTDAARWLPTTMDDMRARGWDELDVLLVSGDAYIDHPSFGIPLLGRWLEHHGYRVGIIAQPRWDRPDDIARLGRPRLFCGISAGSLDSMLCHYTAFRKKRHDDAYTPGGLAGARPNRATIVYANLVRAAFPGLPSASWPTTTSGRTRCGAPCCSTPRPTSSTTAWASAPSSRSRGASRPASPSPASPAPPGSPPSRRTPRSSPPTRSCLPTARCWSRRRARRSAMSTAPRDGSPSAMASASSSSRSEASILQEVGELTRTPGWKGTVSDVGGPTANLWGAS